MAADGVCASPHASASSIHNRREPSPEHERHSLPPGTDEITFAGDKATRDRILWQVCSRSPNGSFEPDAELSRRQLARAIRA
jgi:hypothetical protein